MNARFVACALACALLLGLGCQSDSKKPKAGPAVAKAAPPPAAPPSPTDSECAGRLHDIEGLFLLYGLRNYKLPESLDDLRAMPEAQRVLGFACPASKLPYVYDPNGKPPPSGNGSVIFYDAAPSHGGMRLCIVMEQNTSGAVVPRVIALPEKFFTAP